MAQDSTLSPEALAHARRQGNEAPMPSRAQVRRLAQLLTTTAPAVNAA